MEYEVSTQNITQNLARMLYQNLVRDDYGGWKNLAGDFLKELCERFARESEDFILETLQHECSEKDNQIEHLELILEEKTKRLEFLLEEKELQLIDIRL